LLNNISSCFRDN